MSTCIPHQALDHYTKLPSEPCSGTSHASCGRSPLSAGQGLGVGSSLLLDVPAGLLLLHLPQPLHQRRAGVSCAVGAGVVAGGKHHASRQRLQGHRGAVHRVPGRHALRGKHTQQHLHCARIQTAVATRDRDDPRATLQAPHPHPTSVRGSSGRSSTGLAPRRLPQGHPAGEGLCSAAPLPLVFLLLPQNPQHQNDHDTVNSYRYPLWAPWAGGRCPCSWQGVGTGWALRSLPTQTILWFCDSWSPSYQELANVRLNAEARVPLPATT